MWRGLLLLFWVGIVTGDGDQTTTQPTSTPTPATKPPPPTDTSSCHIEDGVMSGPELPKLDDQFEARVECKIEQVGLLIYY